MNNEVNIPHSPYHWSVVQKEGSTPPTEQGAQNIIIVTP